MKILPVKPATVRAFIFFDGKTNASLLRRGLIAFDLASIPTNATITGVTLSMFLSMSHGDPKRFR